MKTSTVEALAIVGVWAILGLLAIPRFVLMSYEVAVLWSYLAEPYHLPTPCWGWFWVALALWGGIKAVPFSEADEAAKKQKDSRTQAIEAATRGIVMFVIYPGGLAVSIAVAHVLRANGWLV